jgi:dihydrofolate reductase
MRQIIYYVATSIDGYISGLDEDIRVFAPTGSGVDQYLQDLKSFDTTIMGRKTYEFGYKYGLEPGQPAYPHMDHYIFSNTLNFDDAHQKINVCKPDLEIIRKLKNSEGSDIYLCGGGEFAGWLLDNELIDSLKIKLNPLILGDGIRLFGKSVKQIKLHLISCEKYDNGLLINEYKIGYGEH